MRKFLALNVFLLLAITSCFKQDSPEVRSDYSPIGRDIDRLESCSRVDFSNGFLRQKNVLDLFSCTKWDGKFPALMSAIKEINESDWNNLMEPIGVSFFDDKQRRDRVIRELRRLDDRGALESLGKVLTALNETNFYDAFNELFICAEDSGNEVCRDRPADVVSKERVSSLIGIVNRDKEFFFHLSKLLSSTLEAIRPEVNELRSEIRSFYDTRSFVQLRIKFLNNVMADIEDGIEPETKRLLSQFFTDNIQDGQPYIFRWLNDTNQSEEVFKELLRYPIRKRPQITKDLLVVLDAIGKGLSCRPYSGNNYLHLDIANEMSSVLGAISMFDHGRFIYFLLEKVSLLSTAEVFCDEIRRYSAKLPTRDGDAGLSLIHEISFIELMGESADFVAEPINFDLLSFVTRISTLDTAETHFYPLRLATSRTALASLEILELVDEKTHSYFDIMFRALRRFDVNGFENLGELSRLINDESFLDSVTSLSQLWRFYTDEEKNFLFKIVDRHMDEETDLVSLLEFYVEIIEEMIEASEKFRSHWFADEGAQERFYYSVRSFVGAMSGEDVLEDFQLFFSRDHIIEIIKVVTQGVSLTEQRRASYNYDYRTYYTAASERRDYVLDFRRSDLATNAALRCIKEITEIDRPFYEMIVNLPQDCKSLRDESAPLRAFSWLNETAGLYDELFGTGKSKDLLSSEGAFSPRMLNSMTANTKVLDQVYPDGLEGLFSRIRYHLFDYPRENKSGYYQTLEGLVGAGYNLLNVDHEESKKVRNHTLNKLVTIESDRMEGFLTSSLTLLKDYGEAVKNKELKEPEFNKSRFTYSCHNFLNQEIGYKCPSNYVEVLNGLNLILPYLSKTYDGKTTFLGNLAIAAAVDKGFPIPLNSPNAVPYRMTMRETLKMQYDLSDPSRSINQALVEYTPAQGSTKNQKMSVLERIEVVIRDVKFRLNYLGVQYQNAVTQGDDYNEDVKDRKKLMERCIKVPIVRCGKKMTDDQKRQATNALEAYDGLLDVNNGRGQDSGLRYGNYMKALVSTVVASSAKDAQRVRLFPLGEDLLKLHNGILLAYVTEMGAFSHIGRWVHNRFAPSDEEFNKFLSSPDIAMIDRSFMLGISKEEINTQMQKIGNSLNTESGREFVHDIVQWLYDSGDPDLDNIEKVLGRLFVISSMIGSEEIVLGSRDQEFPQFKNNNSLAMFKLLNIAISNWTTIKKQIDNPMNLRAGFREYFDIVNFLYEKIHSGPEDKKHVYRVVNEVSSALTYFMDTDFSGNALAGEVPFLGETYLELFVQSDALGQFIESIRQGNEYLLNMKLNNDGWHSLFSTTLYDYNRDSRTSFGALKDYLLNTTIENYCDEEGCHENPHYDEPFRVLKLSLSHQDGHEQSNLERTFESLFVDQYEKFEDLLKKLMSALNVRVKEQ